MPPPLAVAVQGLTIDAIPSSAPLEPPTRLGGKWRELPRSPFAAGLGEGVWAGDKMVVMDHRSGRTATYDPSTQRWEEHERVPGKSAASGWAFDGVADPTWTGDEVIVLGSRTGRDSDVTANYAFNPARGRWREIAPSPLEYGGPAVWTGDLLIVASGNRAAAAYDPASDCWLEVPDVPLPEMPSNAHTARAMDWQVGSWRWTGDEVLAVVATDSPRVPLGVASFDPRTWTWRSEPQGPVSGAYPRAILADDRLWFLGEDGNDQYIHNATYDPTTGGWQIIDQDCQVDASYAVWTGRLILEPESSGDAFDPATGECLRLPLANDRPRNTSVVVWTGREAIHWSGSWGDAVGRTRPDGIVYRPPMSAIDTEQAEPLDRKLRRAIAARRQFGFDTDREIMREIMRSPYQPASRQSGFPMNEDEYRDINSRSWFVGEVQPVVNYVRKLPIFGGVWQDQRAGGALAIALTRADRDVIASIDSMMPAEPDLGWRLVIVPRTLKELKQAFRSARRISKQLDPSAMLWAVGIDESDGLVEFMYDPDDVKRMRARKTKLERRLGVPVRIVAGRVRDT